MSDVSFPPPAYCWIIHGCTKTGPQKDLCVVLSMVHLKSVEVHKIVLHLDSGRTPARIEQTPTHFLALLLSSCIRIWSFSPAQNKSSHLLTNSPTLFFSPLDRFIWKIMHKQCELTLKFAPMGSHLMGLLSMVSWWACLSFGCKELLWQFSKRTVRLCVPKWSPVCAQRMHLLGISHAMTSFLSWDLLQECAIFQGVRMRAGMKTRLIGLSSVYNYDPCH